MTNERIPTDPYRPELDRPLDRPGLSDEYRNRPQRFDDELTEGPARGGKITLFAICIALVWPGREPFEVGRARGDGGGRSGVAAAGMGCRRAGALPRGAAGGSTAYVKLSAKNSAGGSARISTNVLRAASIIAGPPHA